MIKKGLRELIKRIIFSVALANNSPKKGWNQQADGAVSHWQSIRVKEKQSLMARP